MHACNNAAAPPVTPLQWGRSLSGPPAFSTRAGGRSHGLLRRWSDTSPEMQQPALDHHYVVLHLGGPKRVTRNTDTASTTTEVAVGAVTVVPAGSIGDWRTEGPIDFAHLYLAPATIEHVTAQELDRDARQVKLVEAVGARDPLLEALFASLLEEARSPGAGTRVYLDTLLHGFILRLLRGHSTLSEIVDPALHSLAPYRLRNVLAFIDANSSRDVSLADLAEAAGCSPYHFSRAFTRATGKPPYAYLLAHRLERAKAMLRDSVTPVAEIALLTGFHAASQFSRMFKRSTGATPGEYRRERGLARHDPLGS